MEQPVFPLRSRAVRTSNRAKWFRGSMAGFCLVAFLALTCDLLWARLMPTKLAIMLVDPQ